MTAFDDRLEQAYDMLDNMHTSYGETLAEARNEVAMFGDSWPGSGLQLADSNSSIKRFEKHLELMVEKVQPMFEKFSEKGDHEGARICLTFFESKPDKLSVREAKAWEVLEAL